MICINKYFSNILSNEKKKEIFKEYIVPNKFDLNLIKFDFHFIKNIEARVHYEDCNNISSLFINYIKMEIGNQVFYKRGKNEILCFEHDDEYMKYEIQFPTSHFFPKEKHFLFLHNVFSFYKIKVSGYVFEEIDLILNLPKQPNKTLCYDLIFDHHSNFFQEGKFYCKSNYKLCYVNYIKYCPQWFQENYEICDYKLPNIVEDYKDHMKEYIITDNNNDKHIMFFINKLTQILPLQILASHSLNNLFYTHMKNTYKTYMAGAFYKKKTKYYYKSYDFRKINLRYIIDETNCDGFFKMTIKNKLQQFLHIDTNIDIKINHIDFFLNIDNVNNEIFFDNILLSDNKLYITFTIDKIYEKYLEILEIELACICLEESDIRKLFLTNEILLKPVFSL